MAETEHNTIKKFTTIWGGISHWIQILIYNFRTLMFSNVAFFKESKDYYAAKKDN